MNGGLLDFRQENKSRLFLGDGYFFYIKRKIIFWL